MGIKVLFLTIGSFPSINDYGIYSDLLREFLRHGHEVYVVCANEKRVGLPTVYEEDGGAHILRVKTGNITQTNIVEKGISTILIKRQYLLALKKYYKEVRFGLVLYPTPPITLCGVVEYIKKRDGAKTYLLLKDIFPQNAVDLGMMSTSGIKSVVYRYFKSKEKKLYRVSDRIGCMSAANVDYILNHNPEVKARNDREKNGKSIVEVCPNCIEPMDMSISIEERAELRKKYNIPLEKTVFVYGGNLGKPQGIRDLLYCISKCETENIFFLIIGSGTEYKYLEQYAEEKKSHNLKLMPLLPKEEYEMLIRCCDVGLICLDKRFTIPNFPSRMLSYMQASLPILAMTDVNTDVGKVISEGGFGYWGESGDAKAFVGLCNKLLDEKSRMRMGKNARRYLAEFYSVEKGYEIIIRHLIR